MPLGETSVPQGGTTVSKQGGKSQGLAQVTIIGEAVANVRDTVCEQPFISDAFLDTCLWFVLDGPTLADETSCLCINVELLHINAPEHDSLSILFPPTSDFDLVRQAALSPCLIGCTLPGGMSTKTTVLVDIHKVKELLH